MRSRAETEDIVPALGAFTLVAALALHWLLSVIAVWVAGQGDRWNTGPLTFEWAWVPVWVVPEVVIACGVLLGLSRRRSGGTGRLVWLTTGAIASLAAIAWAVLVVGTRFEAVRGVPRRLVVL